MNQETLIICKHEVAKLMQDYKAISGKRMSLTQIVEKNSLSIYLLADIVKALLEDKE